MGELITFPGHISKPIEAGNRATKAFLKIGSGFCADEKGMATFKGDLFMTSAGPVTASMPGRIT